MNYFKIHLYHRKCSPLFQGHALKVRVRGIEVMNDDPSEVKVLYAKVEDPSEGLLQEIVDKIVDYFIDAGLSIFQLIRVQLLHFYFFYKV